MHVTLTFCKTYAIMITLGMRISGWTKKGPTMILNSQNSVWKPLLCVTCFWFFSLQQFCQPCLFHAIFTKYIVQNENAVNNMCKNYLSHIRDIVLLALNKSEKIFSLEYLKQYIHSCIYSSPLIFFPLHSWLLWFQLIFAFESLVCYEFSALV